MFSRLSIKTRLFMSLAGLSALMAAIAASGWVALDIAQGSLQTVYADRVVPLRQLKTVSDKFAVDIVDTAH